MAFCTDCGAEVRAESLFCGQCGSPARARPTTGGPGAGPEQHGPDQPGPGPDDLGADVLGPDFRAAAETGRGDGPSRTGRRTLVAVAAVLGIVVLGAALLILRPWTDPQASNAATAATPSTPSATSAEYFPGPDRALNETVAGRYDWKFEEGQFRGVYVYRDGEVSLLLTDSSGDTLLARPNGTEDPAEADLTRIDGVATQLSGWQTVEYDWNGTGGSWSSAPTDLAYPLEPLKGRYVLTNLDMPGERGVPYAAARTALILGEFGHSLSKEAAIEALVAAHRTAVEGAPEHSVVPIVKDETVSMLVTDPTSGEVQIGDTSGLRPVDAADVTMTDGSASALAGYETLNLGSLTANVDYTAQWNVLCVPMPDGQGRFLCPIAMTRAALVSSLAYDGAADTLTDPATGEVFRADDEEQSFVSESTGERLVPGWRPS